MKYFIVREDQLLPDSRENLEKAKRFFTSQEVVEINALSAIELSKGNTKLNNIMYYCTEKISRLEIKNLLHNSEIKK